MAVLWEALNNVTAITMGLLLLSLIIALGFEFINGFHDTANAIAMIVYTNSMKAGHSVVMAGVMNFLGVLTGGVGVAFAIVNLLPVDILVSTNQQAALAMVYSLLISAVLWNFGTWYFGLPVSSSHSLIGSIIGVSIAFGVLNGFDLSSSVNWKTAYGVLLALFFSPIFGFGLAYILMKLSRKYVTDQRFFNSPSKKAAEKNEHPNFWARIGIIATGAGVSYAHGSNDGQKGIGLIMIILIGVLPAYFAINLGAKEYDILNTRDSAANLAKFYADNNQSISNLISNNHLHSALKATNTIVECDINNIQNTASNIANKLDGIKDYRTLSPEDRWSIRTSVICTENYFHQVSNAFKDSDPDKTRYLEDQLSELKGPAEYAPYWVIVAVALAIGIGTMIGYKRIVVTIGEKIGSKPINYMQGTAAQATAMATILLADMAHAPVSTTHVLSSSVAGSMVAEPDGGVQKETIRSIILAWVLTLPITAIIGSAIYVFLHSVMG